MASVKTVTVRRNDYTVELIGDDITDARFNVELSRPGVVDAIVSDLSGVKWVIEVHRPRYREEDPFPVDMPSTICSAHIYAREDRTEEHNTTPPLEYGFLDHLYVQEQARGCGYGKFLWDCYLAVVAHIAGDARGKVGETEDGNTNRFLESRGVQSSSMEKLENETFLAPYSIRWDANGENVINGQPVQLSEVR